MPTAFVLLLTVLIDAIVDLGDPHGGFAKTNLTPLYEQQTRMLSRA